MKVIAFNGSPRREGNTALLLNTVLAELATEGIETMRDLGQNRAWLLKKVNG